ncbi:MAG: chromosomal replication initiator protein DnaA [Acidobacteria bacterium]|nr:chromosomal replication initiator protein DnaA [Acidobacteriota bacterium]
MQIWRRIRTRLEDDASRETFENWLEPIESEELDGQGVLQLIAPNSNVRDLLETEYKPKILAAAAAVGVQVRDVSFLTRPSTPRQEGTLSGAEPLQQSFNFKDRSTSQFSGKYRFDNFVVGSCNEFAHAAAQAVAANPAKAYNPLYMYGGVGMGKTHLMHAIGQRLEENFPGIRVVYVSSEEFMNEMIASLRYDRMSSFHERFRAADALLVDDIQILGSRERTQEEFFHTFNTLHNLDKQIVLSSDMPPKLVPGLVDRLRSRFSWGLMADIQPPDLETKMAILDRKAEEAGIRLPDAVRSVLATHLRSNIRELEGALIRLMAISSVAGAEITTAMAKQALRSIAVEDEARPTLAAIQRAVAEEFDLKPVQLSEKNNAKAISYPRQIAMYLCKEILGMSLPEIGKSFGGKHHTTVLHAVGKIDKLRSRDESLNNLIHRLSNRFS